MAERKVQVELVCQMDLAHPMEAVQVAREVRAQLAPTQWEAVVLLASALIEQADPVMVLNLARAVKERADRAAAEGQIYRVDQTDG